MGAAILQLRSEIQARFDIPLEIRKLQGTRQFSTGIPAIDVLTDGGIPRGTLTEICGTESSGRTALMFTLLGNATRGGECCAWIDAAGAFDPQSACDAGVDLERVLWVNCGGNAEHALKSTDLLIQAGGFGLVVMDLADTPAVTARRISMTSWFRLRRAVEHTPTVLLVVEQQPHAKTCASLTMEMRCERAAWSGTGRPERPPQAESLPHNLLRGIRVRVERRKPVPAIAATFESRW